MITRETLEAKKQQLEAGIAQLEATLIANRGALQMVEALLSESDEEPTEPEPDPSDTANATSH